MHQGKSPTWTTISGLPISYAYRQRVINAVKDEQLAARVFFRCIEKGAKDPIRWIAAGIKAGYAYASCEAEYQKGAFKDWYDTVWNQPVGKRQRGPEQLKSILKGMFG